MLFQIHAQDTEHIFLFCFDSERKNERTHSPNGYNITWLLSQGNDKLIKINHLNPSTPSHDKGSDDAMRSLLHEACQGTVQCIGPQHAKPGCNIRWELRNKAIAQFQLQLKTADNERWGFTIFKKIKVIDHKISERSEEFWFYYCKNTFLIVPALLLFLK